MSDRDRAIESTGCGDPSLGAARSHPFRCCLLQCRCHLRHRRRRRPAPTSSPPSLPRPAGGESWKRRRCSSRGSTCQRCARGVFFSCGCGCARAGACAPALSRLAAMLALRRNGVAVCCCIASIVSPQLLPHQPERHRVSRTTLRRRFNYFQAGMWPPRKDFIAVCSKPHQTLSGLHRQNLPTSNYPTCGSLEISEEREEEQSTGGA